jgi:hypothetical protein
VLVGDDDHTVYVSQIGQSAHDCVRVEVDVDELTRAHVCDEESPLCGVERGVVEARRAPGQFGDRYPLQR